jgi:hypothetical protein
MRVGIGELEGIAKLDLSGINFEDENGTALDLKPLYVMDALTDLWLEDTKNLDASDLDLLLDNLATIEGASTEGILHMAQVDFDAFNTGSGGLLAAWDAEPGHHVAFVSESLLGDLNLDGEVNGLDADPFVDVLLNGPYQLEADMNEDHVVNGLDVDSFVSVVLGRTQSVPEPSAFLLAILALACIGDLFSLAGGTRPGPVAPDQPGRSSRAPARSPALGCRSRPRQTGRRPSR